MELKMNSASVIQPIHFLLAVYKPIYSGKHAIIPQMLIDLAKRLTYVARSGAI
jgi:hypothetical protein